MKIIPTPRYLPQQRGIALIASLIILLLMTIVALSVFRSNNLIEKMTGNTREKQRAFEVAQSALSYGEWWLTQPTSVITPVTCSTTTAFVALQVCNAAAPATAAQVAAIQTYNGFRPTGINITAGGGTASSGDVKYSKAPGIYISTQNQTISGGTNILYYVTAIGYGGSNGATGTEAIIQSTYTINSITSGTGGQGGTNGRSATSGSNLGGP